MSQEQLSTITGSVLDSYTTDSQDYKENRMPRVGQLCAFEDGRKFVFCSTDADITVGQGCAAQVENATAVAGAWGAGLRTFNVTEASIAANAWAGGIIIINKVPYKIKSNSATDDPGAGLVAVTVYDALITALTDTQVVSVRPLRSNLVTVSGVNSDVVGTAAAVSTAATSGLTNFIWVQYAGPGVIANVADAAGAALMPGALGAGILATAGQPIIAVQTGAVVDGVAACNLQCAGNL